MTKRTKIIIGTVAAVVAIGAVVLLSRRGGKDDIRTVAVEQRSVKQEVTFTGALEAVQAADLGFQTGGLVTSIPVEVGQAVSAGQLLVQLDARSASLERARAFADRVSGEAATYLAWQSAEADWTNTKKVNTYTVAKQTQAVRDAKLEVEQAEKTWQASANDNGDESATAQAAYATLVAKRSAYNAAQKTLNELVQSTTNTAASARAAADAAKEANVATKQAAGNVAGLSSLAALEQLSAVQLSYSSIRAPFSGVVTDITSTAGEYATAGTVQVSIQSVDRLQVTSDVTEVDAAKLSVGLPAAVTFDVFPTEDGVAGEVAAISPAAKIIEGVPTYEVAVQLQGSDKRLKPGFTANISIGTAERTNVLAIPRRAVITQDDRQFVRVRGDDGFIAEYPVETGLVGSDGSIEITSGVQRGMQVIVNPSQTDTDAAH